MDGVLSPAQQQDSGGASPPTSSGLSIAPQREFELKDSDFKRVSSKIYAEAGIVLGKQKRDMIIRRLSKRVRALGLDSFRAYMDRVQAGDKDELVEFRNALTTNLTSFFREAHHFDRLKKYFAEHGDRKTYRIWSAACSTGEEPYSIAMSAVEHFRTERPPVRLLCTDIDTQVVATAQGGVYPLERIESLSLERRRKFFQKGAGSNAGMVRVNPALRGFMQFRTMNLMSDIYDVKEGVDVVFLRNVMIYFDRDTQRHILERMQRILAPEGLLVVGHSENLFHVNDLFRSLGQTVYTPVPRE